MLSIKAVMKLRLNLAARTPATLEKIICKMSVAWNPPDQDFTILSCKKNQNGTK